MQFGIREKIALLVVIATAASAFLVAKLLTTRATQVLRDHELVDLGDEAALRGWVMADKIDGLREDVVTTAFNPNFREAALADADPIQLTQMAEMLCQRHWKNHLRIDLITLGQPNDQVLTIEEKATLPGNESWFPDPNASAGKRLHLSPIQRIQVTHEDLYGDQEITRWEPVIWALAPLNSLLGSEAQEPVYLRILMSLYHEPSARHFFAVESAAGEQIVRHDEFDAIDSGNDAVFSKLQHSPPLSDAITKLEEERIENGNLSKVNRLALSSDIKLAQPFFFQEGIPRPHLRKAIRAFNTDQLHDVFDRVKFEIDRKGRAGGLGGGVKEVRLLARSREDLAEMRRIVESAFSIETGESGERFRWRDVIECDEIHAWTVRVGAGSGEIPSDYFIHFAVFDDELASSINYEMRSVRRITFLVAAGFGAIGFLIVMWFIQPLKQMTDAAQRIAEETQSEKLHSKLGSMAEGLSINRRDEVGDIARASKRLFAELLASQEQLEQRVNERTRELRRANTEMEKANEKLMSLSHEKDAFVAKISHDLRQPLNAIFLQVEALKLSDLDDVQRKDVDRIHAHAARELNLVNDILEYQKIIMGAETLNKDSIDVEQVIQDLAHIHSQTAKAKSVDFHTHREDDVVSLVADERRLRQILNNLVGNACKFTSEGSVSLEARSREINQEPWIEFTVTDTGRGMSPQEQAKAFVPFVSNKKDNAGGSGLGLSICKELVAQMGGKIGFVSELDKGTHFSVFLPVEATSEHYNPRQEPIPLIQKNTALLGEKATLDHDATVLVIDDDIAVRELLKRILEGEGYHVITANDGNEGLELAEKHLPDAITLDVVMPGGKDGWEVLQQLKSEPRTQAIPVVMVSVMAEQENGLTLDVEDYLVKPIDVERLSRVIHRATTHSMQRNLLLIDDEKESLEAMSRVLENSGWQTILAHDGAEALAMLEKTRPAAIVLDLIMPGMDGFEFLQKIQEDEHLQTIPVIVMTGKDPDEAEQEFLRDRVATILRKDSDSASNLIASINAKIRKHSENGEG